MATDADVFGLCDREAATMLFGSTAPKEGAPLGGAAVVESEFDEKFYSCSRGEQPCAVLERLAGLGVGIACRKGRKASPNQDNVFFCRVGSITFCGVADGHGDFGHWASHWVARYASAVLAEAISDGSCFPTAQIMEKVFHFAHEALEMRSDEDEFDVELSGSTLSVCCIDHEARTIIAGWAGDSTSIRAWGPVSDLKVEALTVDHNPKDPQERKRILASGGQICAHEGSTRVNPVPKVHGAPVDPSAGLAVTRALGDVSMSRCGVSARPSHKKVTCSRGAEFALVCSDGIWEYLSHRDAAVVVAEYGPSRASEAAQALVAQSRERWMAERPDGGDTDDLSAVVVWLDGHAKAAVQATE